MTKGYSSKFNIRPSVHQKLSPKQLKQSLPSPQTEVQTTSPGPGRTNTQHVHGRAQYQRRNRTLSAELWQPQRNSESHVHQHNIHALCLTLYRLSDPTDPKQRHPADSSKKQGRFTNHMSLK